MPRGVEAGYRERRLREHRELRRQRREFLVGMHALHREHLSARSQMPRGDGRERAQVGEGAGDDDVERQRGCKILDAHRMRFDVGELQLDRRLHEERRLLVVRINHDDMRVGARDRERNARYAAAGAHVEDAQSRRCRKVRHDRERIEQMMRDHALRFADRRQVVRLVPLRQQREIRGQRRALCCIQRETERRDPRREIDVVRCRMRDRGHADSASLPARAAAPPLRCTSKSEIVAGVIPEMRAACPMVSGLWRFSFCCASADSPRTLR